MIPTQTKTHSAVQTAIALLSIASVAAIAAAGAVTIKERNHARERVSTRAYYSTVPGYGVPGYNISPGYQPPLAPGYQPPVIPGYVPANQPIIPPPNQVPGYIPPQQPQNPSPGLTDSPQARVSRPDKGGDVLGAPGETIDLWAGAYCHYGQPFSLRIGDLSSFTSFERALQNYIPLSAASSSSLDFDGLSYAWIDRFWNDLVTSGGVEQLMNHYLSSPALGTITTSITVPPGSQWTRAIQGYSWAGFMNSDFVAVANTPSTLSVQSTLPTGVTVRITGTIPNISFWNRHQFSSYGTSLFANATILGSSRYLGSGKNLLGSSTNASSLENTWLHFPLSQGTYTIHRVDSTGVLTSLNDPLLENLIQSYIDDYLLSGNMDITPNIGLALDASIETSMASTQISFKDMLGTLLLRNIALHAQPFSNFQNLRNDHVLGASSMDGGSYVCDKGRTQTSQPISYPIIRAGVLIP